MTQANVMFPVGRMIGGSVYKAQVETDSFGKPKKNPDGTDVESFSLGVAIPKGAERYWSETPWGKEIVAVGFASHPQQVNTPAYAWKIKDGDSTVPNKNGKVPRDMEGCAGCWIVWFKQRWAPKLVTDKGATQLTEPEGIVPGYFVEVYASVAGNTGPSPGVYLNPIAVNRVAFGERIVTQSVDTTTIGFGQSAALPAGASLTPVGGGFVPPATGGVAGAYQALVPAAQPAITPNPAFLAIPPAPGILPPPPPARVMTAAAKGATYEQMIAAGWNDALLVQHGMMQA